jgi:hypothetical protein
VQPFDSRQAGELGPTVVGAGGEERGVAHEALDLNGIHASVEEVGGEGAAAVMGAEMTDAGLAGPAVDEGVDGLGCEAPDGDPAGLVDRAEQRPLIEASQFQPGGHRSAAADREGGAALTTAFARHGERTGGGLVVVDVEGDRFGPS